MNIFILCLIVLFFPISLNAQGLPEKAFPNPQVKYLSPIQKITLSLGEKEYPSIFLTHGSPVSIQVNGPGALLLQVRINLDPRSPPKAPLPNGPFIFTTVEDDSLTRNFLITGTTMSGARYKDVSVIAPSTGHSFKIDVKEGIHSFVLSISSSAEKGGTIFLSYAAQKLPPPPVGQSVVRARQQGGIFLLIPLLGYGQDFEKESGDSSYMKGGLGLMYVFPNRIGLRGRASDSFYTQTYKYPDRALNVETTQNISEQKIAFDMDGGYVFELVPAFTLFPFFGYKGIYLSSKDFSSSITGMKAGIGIEIHLSKLLYLDAEGDFVYNLLQPDFSLSRLGPPSLGSEYSAGIAYRVSPSFRLRFGYEGEVIRFEEANRLYNGANLGIVFINGGTKTPVILPAAPPTPIRVKEPEVKPSPIPKPAEQKPETQKPMVVPSPTGAKITATAVQPPPPAPGKKARVFIEKKKIVIAETIHFETGKARILPESFPILDEVARVMKDNPNISVRIEGHTDNVGKAELNLQLSQGRADSVMKYLVSKDVSPNRLEARGYGGTIPIADDKTLEGRAKNRRVEFTIIKE